MYIGLNKIIIVMMMKNPQVLRSDEFENEFGWKRPVGEEKE